ncbi:Hypothetical predicted protein [Lecanosticta acicola]|uniref:Uncharacterized protein n=1 Tax=Lecanosticta acicola TaxID=111012 RepID=A0AAI8Z5I8_9PEZI|nr:Hypothetical predicted protein [Lecanosticta acicola]
MRDAQQSDPPSPDEQEPRSDTEAQSQQSDEQQSLSDKARQSPSDEASQYDQDDGEDTRSDVEEGYCEAVVRATGRREDWVLALDEFREAWRKSTDARGGAIRAPDMMRHLDADSFCVLELMIKRTVHARVPGVMRHFDRSEFWRLSQLDMWGLFGKDGNTLTFLQLLQNNLYRHCRSAEEAVGFLKQARESRIKGETKVSNRARNMEWTPTDAKGAVELAKAKNGSIADPPTPPTRLSSKKRPKTPSAQTRPKAHTARGHLRNMEDNDDDSLLFSSSPPASPPASASESESGDSSDPSEARTPEKGRNARAAALRNDHSLLGDAAPPDFDVDRSSVFTPTSAPTLPRQQHHRRRLRFPNSIAGTSQRFSRAGNRPSPSPADDGILSGAQLHDDDDATNAPTQHDFFDIHDDPIGFQLDTPISQSPVTTAHRETPSLPDRVSRDDPHTTSASKEDMGKRRGPSTPSFAPIAAKKQRTGSAQVENATFDPDQFDITLDVLDTFVDRITHGTIAFSTHGSIQEAVEVIREYRAERENDSGDDCEDRRCFMMVVTFRAPDGTDSALLVWIDWRAQSTILCSPLGYHAMFQDITDAAGMKNIYKVHPRDGWDDESRIKASINNAFIASIAGHLVVGSSKPAPTSIASLPLWSYLIHRTTQPDAPRTGQAVVFPSKASVQAAAHDALEDKLKCNPKSKRPSSVLASAVSLCHSLLEDLKEAFRTTHTLQAEAITIRKLIEHIREPAEPEPAEAEGLRATIEALRKAAAGDPTLQSVLEEKERVLRDLLQPHGEGSLSALDEVYDSMGNAIIAASEAAADFTQAQKGLVEEADSAITVLTALRSKINASS